MNPSTQYTFRSAKGQIVNITSRLGEDSARSAAMLHFWGPAHGWCQNIGTGLTLLEAKEVEAA